MQWSLGHREQAQAAARQLIALESGEFDKRQVASRCLGLAQTLINQRQPDRHDIVIELGRRAVVLQPVWSNQARYGFLLYQIERLDDAHSQFEAALPGATAAKQPYYP